MNKQNRSSPKDIWNSFMVKGATFLEHDIPYCPTTAKSLPAMIITYDEAKSIYKRNVANGNNYFSHLAYVCFYMDDYKFDGAHGIWQHPQNALKILRHFAGVITPDFSTYQDFPEPLKLYNTYRMRAFGYWLCKCGLNVINNVRWGTKESFDYCFVGIPKNSVVAIGTLGGSPKKHIDRQRFNEGFAEMLKILRPYAIIIYGSANYSCFDDAKAQGIQIVDFPSKTAKAFSRRKQQ